MITAFISYSRKDKLIAQQLHEDLEFRGINSWLDVRDIAPGEPWAAEIEQAIHQCEYFLLLLSPHSLASEYVQLEYEIALTQHKRLIPLLLQVCDPPPAIARIQHLDLRDYRQGLDQLLKVLPRMDVPSIELTAYLQSQAVEARIYALTLISDKKYTEMVQAVITAMQDAHPDVRAAAALALDKMLMVESIPVLATALSDPVFSVRSAAGWALVHLGEAAISAVGNVLCTSQNTDAREMAAQVLMRIGGEAAHRIIRACGGQ